MTVNKWFVHLADREWPYKKCRVIYHLQISLKIGAMADFVAKTECLFVLHYQGHELALFTGRKEGVGQVYSVIQNLEVAHMSAWITAFKPRVRVFTSGLGRIAYGCADVDILGLRVWGGFGIVIHGKLCR